MDLNFIRWIDKTFGPVIAQFLFVAGLLLGRFRKRETSFQLETVKKILLIKFFGGGSILLASPIIHKIKGIHPDATISIITLSENREICSLLKAIDKIYYLDLKNPFSFFLKYFKLIQEIKNKN